MRIGRNARQTLATSTAVLALGVIVSVVVTRRLGPEGRGVYFLLVSTNFLVAEVSRLGIGTALAVAITRRRRPVGELNAVALLGSAASGAAGLAATSIAFLFLGSSVFRNVPYAYLVVALLIVPAVVYQGHFSAILAALGRVPLLNTVTLVANVFSATLIGVLVGAAGYGLRGFLVAWSTAAFLTALAMAAIAHRIDPVRRPRRDTARELLGFGLRAHWGAIARLLLLRFDIYAVNVAVGTAAVGVYSVATSLAERLWLPANALTTASLAEIGSRDDRESGALTTRVALTSLVAATPLGVGAAVSAIWLLPFAYGRAFEAAVVPFAILVGGAVLFGATLVMHTYVLTRMRRPGLLSLIECAQLLISIPLYIVLIRAYGITGAATASTIGYCLAFAATASVFVRHLARAQRA
jgi:O-antigen/teichoic acid export membrane protein